MMSKCTSDQITECDVYKTSEELSRQLNYWNGVAGTSLGMMSDENEFKTSKDVLLRPTVSLSDISIFLGCDFTDKMECRTGMRDPTTGEVITTLLGTSFIGLKIPKLSISIQFHSNGYFCGWHPASSEEFNNTTVKEIPDVERCLELCTAGSIILNTVSGAGLHKYNSDGVGLIQMAIFGHCYSFPFIGTGIDRAEIMSACMRLAAAAACQPMGSKLADGIRSLSAAVRLLPADVQIQPVAIPDATSRALYCMPSDEISYSAPTCRKQLQAASLYWTNILSM